MRLWETSDSAERRERLYRQNRSKVVYKDGEESKHLFEVLLPDLHGRRRRGCPALRAHDSLCNCTEQNNAILTPKGFKCAPAISQWHLLWFREISRQAQEQERRSLVDLPPGSAPVSVSCCFALTLVSQKNMWLGAMLQE
jgi:hypothetical protein